MFGCPQEDEHVVSHRVSMQTLTSAGGHFEFSKGTKVTTLGQDLIENISAKFGFELYKDCQSILEEVVSADRTKNNNKMAKLSN